MSTCRGTCCRPAPSTVRPVVLSVLADVAFETPNADIPYLRRSRVESTGNAMLESVAEARIEFGQLVCSIFLILNRKIFPVTAYFPAAYFERFEIANITRMQDV
jgi:hypothetical protein